MDIKACKFCKKTFRGFGALCPVCAQQLDEKYVTVRNYLDKHTGGNISVVAKESEVDEKSLLYLIREGRITLASTASAITCIKCGMPILSGKYCDKCKGDLVRTLETTINSMESSKKPAQPAQKPADEKGKLHILKDR